MPHFKFPSLAQPEKYGYLFDSMHHSTYVEVDDACLFFDTYGDGMTQHSLEVCIPTAFAADYFASLAAFLLECPDMVDSCRFHFSYDWPDSLIEFAASVVYKDPPEGKWAKPRYYSMEEKKISSSESKRHDKRYEEITSWMNGKADAIQRLLWKPYYSPLQTFAMNHRVRDWCNTGTNNGRPWCELPKLGKDTTRDEAHKQESCWRMLKNTLDHLVGLDCCRGNVKHYLDQLAWERKRAAEQAGEVSDAA
jgi:hypothetical protein